MSENSSPKRKLTRSPGYPSLYLGEAIERAKVLWEKEKRHAAPLSAIESHLGYKVGGGAVARVISALGKFGLVVDEGIGSAKQYKLSESALKILLSPENSIEQRREIRASALKPALHQELWEQYQGSLPSDETLRSYLVLKRNFNPGMVDEFIANFRATLDFAGTVDDDWEVKQPDFVPPSTTTEQMKYPPGTQFREPPAAEPSSAKVVTTKVAGLTRASRGWRVGRKRGASLSWG